MIQYEHANDWPIRTNSTDSMYDEPIIELKMPTNKQVAISRRIHERSASRHFLRRLASETDTAIGHRHSHDENNFNNGSSGFR